MKKAKKIVLLLIVFFVIGIQTISYGKYVIEYTYTIANINTDEVKPEIVLLDIKNTNKGYENYANCDHTITATVKIIEKSISVDNFNKENVKIMIGNKALESGNISIKQKEIEKDYRLYEIKMDMLQGNGEIKIDIPEGIVEDLSENKNTKTILNTKIELDNIMPILELKEEETEDGKVKFKISSNEKIRKKDGWEQSENCQELIKEFPSNAKYKKYIADFAQNTVELEINVTKATYLQLKYGSYNNRELFKWSFNDKESDIVGKDAIKSESNYKTEMIAFNYDGNIEKDFIKIQSYLHTYWKEGSILNCYEMISKYGYNPDNNRYLTMEATSENIAKINGTLYIVMGSDLVNYTGAKLISGSNTEKIPEEIAKQNLFGISSLKLELKDNSLYSILYQINVKKYGWQKTSVDGEESTYSHNEPISGYRVVVVPKSEKYEVIRTWNKDMYTNNV